MGDDIAQHDERRRRCPMLGHDVPFSYCRAPGAPRPCRRVFDCWWETFDIRGFVCSHFSEEDVRQITAPRPDKAATIVELIRRAQNADKDQG